ncbi:hypothetical protein [Massilia sp. CF038]|uniref:hypothetical protein n=1 Tax=Massilia sp. CF038 TaxID=1881045 RepID=UPI000934BFD2|nr:hypothetical protein [Massilia sp. CF038]
MSDLQITIDLSYAKNALFIRQSVAVAFGVPIDRELTWDFLRDRIGSTDTHAMPNDVTVRGLPNLSGALGEESQMFLGLLRTLGAVHGTKVMFVIHD